MPAKSKAQQQAAGAALAAKRGEIKASALKGASRQMYRSMNEAQLDEFASTKRKGKPAHVAAAKTARTGAAKGGGKKVAARKAAKKKPARRAAKTSGR